MICSNGVFYTLVAIAAGALIMAFITSKIKDNEIEELTDELLRREDMILRLMRELPFAERNEP